MDTRNKMYIVIQLLNELLIVFKNDIKSKNEIEKCIQKLEEEMLQY